MEDLLQKSNKVIIENGKDGPGDCPLSSFQKSSKGVKLRLPRKQDNDSVVPEPLRNSPRGMGYGQGPRQQ